MQFDHTSRSQILDAIEHELEVAQRPDTFVVRSCEMIGPLWQVEIDEEAGGQKNLDEGLEGYAAWWVTPGGETATADVLAVVPDIPAITLRFCSARPPSEGGRIRIYPPLFLDALRTAWLDQDWANRSIDWGRAVLGPPSRAFTWDTPPRAFPWLREAQRASFQLPGWNAAYLWGPPGTGKTTTLGAMLAQVLIERPEARICLTSTTNSAVDLALIHVDKALEALSPTRPAAAAARGRLKRIGNHFVASNYENRGHLLPEVDEELLKRMVELETRKPDPAETLAYAAWKLEVEHLRMLMRESSALALANSALVAMTTTRAIFGLDKLRQLATYDLLVFDEASQVSLPHALALAPLAASVLFAGDHKQLGPIVQSQHPTAQEWLGRSGFDLMDEDGQNTCLLDEQSRMAPDICRVVSRTFYDGKLRVAADAAADPGWHKARDTRPEPNAIAIAVDQPGTWSQTYGGYIRYTSAQKVADVAARLLGFVDPEHVVVLTPFRAQRRLIRSLLGNMKRRIKVSTVHRAQGSECDHVIFDWVRADNGFLEDVNGQRLLNVAISRARKQLHVLWSVADRENPTADRILGLIETMGLEPYARPVRDYCGKGNFPWCMLADVVVIGAVCCKIVDVLDDGARFQGLDLATGLRRTFVTGYVRERFC